MLKVTDGQTRCRT